MINYYSAIPLTDEFEDDVFLSIYKKDIPQWAERYIKHLDTSVTQEVCKCEWIAHPDDIKIRPLHCRECKHPREDHKHSPNSEYGISCITYVPRDIPNDKSAGECGCHNYIPRRVRMGDQHPHCPMHTPVGRIMGFFEFVFSQESKEDSMPKEEAGKLVDRFNEKHPHIRNLTVQSETDIVGHTTLAERQRDNLRCYWNGCDNSVTDASHYCSQECAELAMIDRLGRNETD